MFTALERVMKVKRNRIGLKRIFVIAICISFILSLCSCNSTGRYAKRDIDEKIIVHALGIDITKDGKFEVTLQMLSQQGAGSNTPIDPSKPNSAAVSQVADTIPAAIERCETDLGKRAFLGHSELILLGKSVVDLEPVLDYVINAEGISLGTFMAYTDITAKEILNIKITSGAYSAEVLKEIFEESQKNGTSTECELIRHIDNLENTNGTTIMPIIKKIKDDKKSSEEKENSSSEVNFGQSKSDSSGTEAENEKVKSESGKESSSDSSSKEDSSSKSESSSKEESSSKSQGESGGGEESGSGGGESGGGSSEEAEATAFYIDGAVIVKNKKPYSVMTRDEIIGLSFLNDGVAEQVIDVKLGDILTGVTAGSVDKNTKVSVKNNRIVVDIRLVISYEFYKSYSKKEQKTAGEEADKRIYNFCDKAIKKALKEDNADLFEIHSLLNHNDYKLYKAYKENPEEILKKIDINVSIDSQI